MVKIQESKDHEGPMNKVVHLADVIENLQFLNSKYLETLQIIVWLVATAKFSNKCESFFTSELLIH